MHCCSWSVNLEENTLSRIKQRWPSVPGHTISPSTHIQPTIIPIREFKWNSYRWLSSLSVHLAHPALAAAQPWPDVLCAEEQQLIGHMIHHWTCLAWEEALLDWKTSIQLPNIIVLIFRRNTGTDSFLQTAIRKMSDWNRLHPHQLYHINTHVSCCVTVGSLPQQLGFASCCNL